MLSHHHAQFHGSMAAILHSKHSKASRTQRLLQGKQNSMRPHIF